MFAVNDDDEKNDDHSCLDSLQFMSSESVCNNAGSTFLYQQRKNSESEVKL